MKWIPIVLLSCSLLACSIPESTPVRTTQQAEQGAYAAALSSDASLSVVSSTFDGVGVWNIADNTSSYHWSHQEGEGSNIVASIHISYDNTYVLTSDREAFALWNLESGDPEGFWRIDESTIRDIAVSNQGRGILVGRGNGKVMFFEPETGRRLEFLGHEEKINSIDLSPNGFFALTGGNDYVAYLWDTRTGQVIHRFSHPSRVTKVALDDEGRYAFTADSKKQARIWDVQTGEPVSELIYQERQKIFSAAAFSKDGKHLLTGSPSRSLILWDVATGKQIKEWRVAPRESSKPPSAVVYAVGFLSDTEVMSISSSGLAEVWQL
ncbi:hypothetical protein EYS14_16900 [Alteromonadaceae bacterium M269]|nr:hypothetical protein EYS14_16900 [Alteromonadaceae bacterium M269]